MRRWLRFRRDLGSYSLLPPGELEGDWPGLEQLAPRTHPLAVSSCCKGIFEMLQHMIFEYCNTVIHVLQKGSSNVGICNFPLMLQQMILIVEITFFFQMLQH